MCAVWGASSAGVAYCVSGARRLAASCGVAAVSRVSAVSRVWVVRSVAAAANAGPAAASWVPTAPRDYAALPCGTGLTDVPWRTCRQRPLAARGDCRCCGPGGYVSPGPSCRRRAGWHCSAQLPGGRSGPPPPSSSRGSTRRTVTQGRRTIVFGSCPYCTSIHGLSWTVVTVGTRPAAGIFPEPKGFR